MGLHFFLKVEEDANEEEEANIGMICAVLSDYGNGANSKRRFVVLDVTHSWCLRKARHNKYLTMLYKEGTILYITFLDMEYHINLFQHIIYNAIYSLFIF